MKKLFICFLCVNLFYSCSKEKLSTYPADHNFENSVKKKNPNADYNKQTRMNVIQLQGVHSQISSELSQSTELTSQEELLFDQELFGNVSKFNTFGFSNFYSMSGLSTNLFIAFNIYKDNQFDPNVYQIITDG